MLFETHGLHSIKWHEKIVVIKESRINLKTIYILLQGNIMQLIRKCLFTVLLVSFRIIEDAVSNWWYWRQMTGWHWTLNWKAHEKERSWLFFFHVTTKDFLEGLRKTRKNISQYCLGRDRDSDWAPHNRIQWLNCLSHICL